MIRRRRIEGSIYIQLDAPKVIEVVERIIVAVVIVVSPVMWLLLLYGCFVLLFISYFFFSLILFSNLWRLLWCCCCVVASSLFIFYLPLLKIVSVGSQFLLQGQYRTSSSTTTSCASLRGLRSERREFPLLLLNQPAFLFIIIQKCSGCCGCCCCCVIAVRLCAARPIHPSSEQILLTVLSNLLLSFILRIQLRQNSSRLDSYKEE